MTTLRTHASLLFCAAMLNACGPNYHITRGQEHLAESRPDAAAQEFQKALDKNHVKFLCMTEAHRAKATRWAEGNFESVQ